MIEFLKELDVEILLLINGMHSPILDAVMIFFTQKFTFIPLYAFLIFLIIKKDRYRSLLTVICIALLIAAADQLASGLMKPLIGRLRPCHNMDLQPLLYLPVGCGGKYSFFSSHAANSFAVAVFLVGYFKKRWAYLLLVWAALVSLSRVYLGNHYPSDITAGFLAGSLLGIIMIYIYRILSGKIESINSVKAY